MVEIKVSVSKSEILSKITEADIFKKYVENFEKFNKFFKSSLYNDTKASCKITQLGNKLVYRDFGVGKSYDCFGYVEAKFGCNFTEALSIISSDFKIKNIIVKPEEIGIIKNKDVIIQKELLFNIKSRKFNNKDFKYWNEYGCNNKWLLQGIIKPITHYWIDNKRYKVDIGYSYYCKPNHYKIYQPLSQFKWCGNIKNYCFGYNELPDRGDLLFITSSYKDVGCLTSLGWNAVETGSESTGISKLTLDYLKERFNKIYIYFNNDNSGIELAKRRSEEWELGFIHNPIGEGKDPSDYYKFNGKDKLNNLIKSLI